MPQEVSMRRVWLFPELALAICAAGCSASGIQKSDGSPGAVDGDMDGSAAADRLGGRAGADGIGGGEQGGHGGVAGETGSQGSGGPAGIAGHGGASGSSGGAGANGIAGQGGIGGLGLGGGAPFVHPGILHGAGDLNRLTQMVAAKTEPYWAGYQVLEANKFSSATYALAGPFAEIGRNPDVNKDAIEADVDAAYQNAVMWAITGDPAHALKTIEILNAWSSTLTAITGNDAILAASLDGFKLANAAEIIRYTNAGWSGADVTAADNLFKTVFYPIIQNFAPFANGNWTAGCIKAMLAFGIFTDDKAMFSRAINWVEKGSDDGALTNYVINGKGQCQESGRDQTHTQLGLGNLAEAAETAWHQDVDLYGLTANRLLAGFEYTASYNLGNTVSFQVFTDTTGKYPQTAISPIDRGQFRPIYEMVYNHYHNRQGLDCPYTQQVAAKLRPEGAWPNADHPGFGTLLFTKPAGSR
jgi:hypothetical protein